MKITSILLCGLILFSTFVQSIYKCSMRWDKRSYMAWYDFGSNLIYGLYDKPGPSAKKCKLCDNFGNKLGQLHYATLNLED